LLKEYCVPTSSLRELFVREAYGGDLKSHFGVAKCCDVTVAQINYPSFKHNIQDSIEQARGRSREEDSSQIFMLDDMQFGGGFGCYLG